MKVELTKCYLIQIRDEEGNEIASEYYFADRQDAWERGQQIKKEIKESRQQAEQ